MIVVWIWVAAALAGLVFALVARQNAADELEMLGSIMNGRRRLGRGHVRDETIVAVIDGTWLGIGLWYVATSTATSTSAVGLILAGTSILLSISTLMRWLDRRYAARPHPALDTQEQKAANAAEDLVFGDQRRELRENVVNEAMEEARIDRA
jgi:hypothetical protein